MIAPHFKTQLTLKVIARYGTGVDKVDFETAHELGIVVTNTAGANPVSVAELTIGLMLSLARHIPAANAATHRGEWPRFRGVSIEGKTVGLVGLGMIGRRVAQRLRGFDCKLVAHDPAPDRDFCEVHGVTLLPLDALLAQADFLSLHAPLLSVDQSACKRRLSRSDEAWCISSQHIARRIS